MRWLAVLATAAFGCAAELEPNPEFMVDGPPRADEAIALVAQRLGLPSATVWWYGPKSLSCDNNTGFDSPTGCRTGITGSNGSIVLWSPGSLAHHTDLVHEVAHQRYGDPDHRSVAVWGAMQGWNDWEPGSVVGDINAALATDGM